MFAIKRHCEIHFSHFNEDLRIYFFAILIFYFSRMALQLCHRTRSKGWASNIRARTNFARSTSWFGRQFLSTTIWQYTWTNWFWACYTIGTDDWLDTWSLINCNININEFFENTNKLPSTQNTAESNSTNIS